jgi:hypothetical protein
VSCLIVYIITGCSTHISHGVDNTGDNSGGGDGSGNDRVGLVVDEIHNLDIHHDPEIHDPEIHVHLDELHFAGWY